MSVFGQIKTQQRGALPMHGLYPLSDGPRPGSSHGHTSRYMTWVRMPLGTLFSGVYGTSGGDTAYYPPRPPPPRYLDVPIPLPRRTVARFQRLPAFVRAIVYVAALVVLITVLRSAPETLGLLGRDTGPTRAALQGNTRVFTSREIVKVWEWEVLSGHHPGTAKVPDDVCLKRALPNPLVSPQLLEAYRHNVTKVKPNDKLVAEQFNIVGSGPEREYVSPRIATNGFPPRPVAGSMIDLDLVSERCNYDTGRHVRDCLELLRLAGRLDGVRVRGTQFASDKQVAYIEKEWQTTMSEWRAVTPADRSLDAARYPLHLPPPLIPTTPLAQRDGPCDGPPRILHMFWFGPFSDKPYAAILSWLYTQNLGLDTPFEAASETVHGTCRPELWVWVEPGLVSLPNRRLKSLDERLRADPWVAPFLHPRFTGIVRFREWNTTEQLDAVPELRGWRNVTDFEDEPAGTVKGRLKTYASLVELSHMARFVLTYRFGGIYAEPDTFFLRDWEELWNYRGQFAYRQGSTKEYSTAVLKLHKGSALAKVIFTTALAHGGDMLPDAIGRYLSHAHLDPLLVRAPDALFDPSRLSVEGAQRDRPPFPSFGKFADLFEANLTTPSLGFDTFFRGAFSYQFHTGWSRPLDPTHNYPDLGPLFAKNEMAARKAAAAAQEAANPAARGGARQATASGATSFTKTLNHHRDLSWSTVLKRTFEAFMRGEAPNMYGDWIVW